MKSVSGQDLQLMITRMEKQWRMEEIVINPCLLVPDRLVGIFSETADLLNKSKSSEWCKKPKTSSERQFWERFWLTLSMRAVRGERPDWKYSLQPRWVEKHLRMHNTSTLEPEDQKMTSTYSTVVSVSCSPGFHFILPKVGLVTCLITNMYY